jgi:hypothetical protein
MTGQDAILNAAALKREAHVRATIVEREDAPAIVDHKDWTVVAMKNKASFGFQLVKAAREHEFLVRHVHKHSRALGTQHRYPLTQARKVNPA